MALTCGFYNSSNGDRKYDAVQFGQIFDGIIKDGVYATFKKGMVVKASTDPGEVIVQPGRAWFNHTWIYNDADLVMQAPNPEVLLDRIDALVIDVNSEQDVRLNTIKWVQGTPSSGNPARPTLIKSTTHNQYPLCYIRRYAETTMIYAKDITNMVGTSECPFVTGVLQGLDIDAWISQWDDEFHTWEVSAKWSFESWLLEQKNRMDESITDVEEWIVTIKDILDDEAAGNIEVQIRNVDERLTSVENSISNEFSNIASIIANVEPNPPGGVWSASKNYSVGNLIVRYPSFRLYRVLKAVSKGGNLLASGVVAATSFQVELANIKGRITSLENQLKDGDNTIYMQKLNGKWGYNTSSNRGADTFTPFRKIADGGMVIELSGMGHSGGDGYENCNGGGSGSMKLKKPLSNGFTKVTILAFQVHNSSISSSTMYGQYVFQVNGVGYTPSVGQVINITTDDDIYFVGHAYRNSPIVQGGLDAGATMTIALE